MSDHMTPKVASFLLHLWWNSWMLNLFTNGVIKVNDGLVISLSSSKLRLKPIVRCAQRYPPPEHFTTLLLLCCEIQHETSSYSSPEFSEENKFSLESTFINIFASSTEAQPEHRIQLTHSDYWGHNVRNLWRKEETVWPRERRDDISTQFSTLRKQSTAINVFHKNDTFSVQFSLCQIINTI